ncbi:protein NRT1/ PTR FAMILY 7.1-like [Ipomoea triloba]|uniref:protein NRT1/ PTR FAMILY 7.1-like n=1 Tax=Ipomoea triloba TaxID=35885 RepID=UPI00125E370D|nr:protein NRT1/ PTR FAMILY 7.1-like [Ipomoea triloba]
MTKGFTSVDRRFPVSPVVIVDKRSSPSPESGTTTSGPFIPFLNRFRKRFACLHSVLKMAAVDSSTHVVAEGAPQLDEGTQRQSGHTEGLNSANNQLININGGNQPTRSISSFLKRFRKKKTGGWNSAIFLLVNQGIATLAFFGVGVNLVVFLTRVLGQRNATAANNVSKWTGTVYLCSLLGAFFSDSYWGRYLTCAIFQLILIVGLLMLSLASSTLLIKPVGCGDRLENCTPPPTSGKAIFYVAIYLVALGYGGHQSTVATLGADQFDESDPKEMASRTAFFSCFYFALNFGSLFSNTILVYFEDSGSWTMGFWASTGSAVMALLLFFLGSPGYTYVQPFGNPFTRISQVFVAAYRKLHVKLPEGQELYEVATSSQSSIRGSRKILHTDNLKCLDKAATVTQNDRFESPNPWRLCTVTQVEETKCILRMLPIWACTIMYSVIFTQMSSLFVEQGEVMDTHLGGRGFRIPAASMSAFDICSVLICTILYRFVVIPVSSTCSNNPKGITELQRMGIGLIIGMLAMVAAGVTEIQRLRRVSPGESMSRLSIFWQVPQYALVGASEVFMYIGQLEFFNGQAPDGIKSFGSSLCMASMSLGNYLSSMLVKAVMAITVRGGEMPGWIPENLNTGHMDRFYFLIAGMAAVDFVLFVLCAKWYKLIKLEENVEEQLEEEHDNLDRIV